MVVLVEAGEVHRLTRDRHLARRLCLGDRLPCRVLVADPCDACLEMVCVLIRLDRGEAQEHLVVTSLLLAHRWIVGPFGNRSSQPRVTL